MIGVILAAGRGSRMKGLTAERPKAMLPVVGLPIIARVVRQLHAAGIGKVIIVVSPSDAHIRPYFEAHPPAEMSLTFVVQLQARGMAHALLPAAPHIDQPFVVTACDSLYPEGFYRQLVHAHSHDDSPATLALMELPPNVIPRASSVELVGGRVFRIVEKPSLAEAPSNIGSLALYVFDVQLLAYLQRVTPSSRGELELQDAIQMMMADYGGVPGVLTPWRWELTIPSDLLELNLWMLRQRPRLAVAPAEITITPPVFVEAQTAFPKDVRIGPHVYIEGGARIGAGARLKNSVVLRDGTVAAGDVVDGKLVSAAINKK